MSPITVVGGGLAGLTAAITCAERGERVELFESHSTLGGRARSAQGTYVTNDGTHTFYVNGEPWQWLVRRGFAGPHVRLSWNEFMRMRFRRHGQLRSTLPREYLAMTLLGRFRTAPVDESFREWGGRHFGERAVQDAVGFLGPVVYDADPARLSARFVFERLLRVGTPRFPLPTRYVLGGWGRVVDRMVAHAQNVGVTIHAGSRISELPTDGPVIVATAIESARALLRDDSLRWETGSCVLTDLALTPSEEDGNVTFDMDEGGFLGHYSDHDTTLAPQGQTLWQGQMPIRPGESKAEAIARLETLCDLTAPRWQDRTVWRRDYVSRGRTGALDLPGTTWRDRPAIDQGGGIFLAGDSVAAPGMLAEASIHSGRTAAYKAIGQVRAARMRAPLTPRPIESIPPVPAATSAGGHQEGHSS